MKTDFEVIFCIVNAGYSDIVMDAAREAGARGGTVIRARGTANKEAEQFYHITIRPDKDLVMILVRAEIKEAVLHALYTRAGLKTEGQGIAFSLPVNDVAGIERTAARSDGEAENDGGGQANPAENGENKSGDGAESNAPDGQ